MTHWWLLWLLPLWGAVLGLVLDRTTRGQATIHVIVGSRSWREQSDSMSLPSAPDVPPLSPWLAPVALVGTVVTHLFGGSVGREGSALQMSGGITSVLARRVLHRPPHSWLMTMSVAAGFSAVFGVPWAGVVFSGEVSQRRWRHLSERVAGAWIAHVVVVGTGFHHSTRIAVTPQLDGRWLVVGAGVGVMAAGLVGAIRIVAVTSRRWCSNSSWRLAIGAVVTMIVGLTTQRDNVGLSLGLLARGLLGNGDVGAWLAKSIATAASVGAGFVGGEVTPLFVLGALGSASIASWVGLSAATGASLGMGSTFAAAARCPFTGVVLSGEVFGWRSVPSAALVMAGTLLTRPRRGIYDEPRSSSRG
jgi:H+/Cl- antiporter ClcA